VGLLSNLATRRKPKPECRRVSLLYEMIGDMSIKGPMLGTVTLGFDDLFLLDAMQHVVLRILTYCTSSN
jgi:hypothetical protein